MADNHKQWDSWSAAEQKQIVQKSIDELHQKGSEAYQQCNYIYAAELFRQAAETARQQSNLERQCKALHWEGQCYMFIGQYTKALSRMLLAEKIGVWEPISRFYNLVYIISISRDLSVPYAQIEEQIKKLEPYKTVQQIGGSKSMVLYWESLLLSDQEDNHQALLRMQEAFASPRDNAPKYADYVYYRELVDAYRINDQLKEARQILQLWREKGKSTHANVKAYQLQAEGKLCYTEYNLDAAWDLFQRVYAEERYLGLAGKNTGTLFWLIKIGVETGRFWEIRPYLRNLIMFRNAESIFSRYTCCRCFSYYYYKLLKEIHASNLNSPDKSNNNGNYSCSFATAKGYAIRWFSRDRRCGGELDALQNVNWRTKRIERMYSEIKQLFE